MEPVEVKEINEGLRVRVFVDDSPLDPRAEFDHMGTMVMVGGHNQIDTLEGDLVAPLTKLMRDYGFDAAARYLRVFHNSVVIQLDNDGILYGSRDKIRAEWLSAGADMPSDDAITEWLEGEWKEYRAWAEGDVYGYVVERIVTVHSASGDVCHYGDWEEVESCWGFYGDSDYTMQEGIKAAESL